MEGSGSDSPRSIRNYHKGGSGTLTGGGIQKIYSGQTPDIKNYKKKLDSRLGQAILLVLITMATLLCLYGLVHGGAHEPVYMYVNRTHQIVRELENAVNENFGGVKTINETISTTEDPKAKKWLTSEELADYSSLLLKTKSTIWSLFTANLVLAMILLPILLIILLNIAEGKYVKLAYRVVLVVCLLFLVAQFLYLIYPLLTGALAFPSMIDRLFVEAYPRDDYQRRGIEEGFTCLFNTNEHLVQYDLQVPCVPKLKNALLPAYGVILMMIIDLIPFAFAVFTYAWGACIKDRKHVQTARQRVQLNNQRRVPIPTSQPISEVGSPMAPRRTNGMV